jgi:putative ABC transport system permease protein
MPTMLRLALRSLARNRRRTAFTLVAVTIGVAVVVFAHGFGEGLVRSLVLQTVALRTGAIQIHAKGYLQATEAAPLKLDMQDDAALRAKIAAVPGVVAVAPRIRFGGLAGNGKVSTMILGEGLDPGVELLVCPARANEIDAGGGSWLRADAARGGVFGAELARALGAAPGGSLTLNAASRAGAVNALDLDVVGVTHGAAFLESKRIVAVPLAYAQELLGMQGRVTEYAVAVRDLDDVPRISADLRAALGDAYEVSAWDEVVPFLRDAVFRVRVVLKGVTVVLFAIVALGVVNTMLMSVFERVREIGTLLAIGWRRRRVLRLFLLEAATIGALGGVAGAALGWGVTSAASVRGFVFHAPGSSFEQVIRPVPSASIALAAVVVAGLGAVLAALYPARKASRMNPVDALRSV